MADDTRDWHERWLDWMSRAGCEAAGCTNPAFAERDIHAPNCLQGEIDMLLAERHAGWRHAQEMEQDADRYRAALDKIAPFEVGMSSDAHRKAQIARRCLAEESLS